jgi:hypothetical protein
MTDVAAPNERDPEIHEAFLSLACAILCRRPAASHFRKVLNPKLSRGRLGKG